MKRTLSVKDIEYIKNAVENDLISIANGEPTCDKYIYEYYLEELEVAAKHLAGIDTSKHIVIAVDKLDRPVWRVE